MKRILLALFVLALGSVTSPAQVAEDDASNYGSSWTNLSNGGFGFTPWVFNMTEGSGFADAFIGNPLDAGITGMNPESFGFYANPLDSGANSEVSRGFLSPLTPGQTFSFQWGLNWDSDSATSNRGFNLRHGASELININMGGTPTIFINGLPMFTQFGSQAFTLNFEQINPSSLRVFGTGRDGSELYDNTFSNLAGPADAFSFYFNASDPGAQRQMYVNEFQVVPEPNSTSLILLGALGLIAHRYRAYRLKRFPPNRIDARR